MLWLHGVHQQQGAFSLRKVGICVSGDKVLGDDFASGLNTSSLVLKQASCTLNPSRIKNGKEADDSFPFETIPVLLVD